MMSAMLFDIRFRCKWLLFHIQMGLHQQFTVPFVFDSKFLLKILNVNVNVNVNVFFQQHIIATIHIWTDWVCEFISSDLIRPMLHSKVTMHAIDVSAMSYQ